jgi:hypothetical protein
MLTYILFCLTLNGTVTTQTFDTESACKKEEAIALARDDISKARCHPVLTVKSP